MLNKKMLLLLGISVMSVMTLADTLGPVKKLPIYHQLPRSYFCHNLTVIGDYLYIIGGHGSGRRLADVWFTKVNNGDLSGWKKTKPLPPGKAGFLFNTVITNKDFIYVLGGNYKDQAGKHGISDEVWFAKAGKDGQLDKWTKTASLPVARSFGASLVVNGNIYYLGGRGKRDIYMTTIKANGSLDMWSKIAKLPTNLYGMHVLCIDGYMYVIGGNILFRKQSEKVFRAKVLKDGKLGKWKRTESLPEPLGQYNLVVKNKELFLFGGTNKQGRILKSTIGADGHLTKWEQVGILPEKCAQNRAMARIGNYIYFGGGIILGKLNKNKVLQAMYNIPIIEDKK